MSGKPNKLGIPGGWQRRKLGKALKRAAARREADVRRARQDPAAFVEYVMTHERTGRRIRNARHHIEWHRFLDAHRRAVLWAPVEHGKTQQVAVGRVLYAIGSDPSRRIAIISDTAYQSMRILSAVKAHIEQNHRVKEVFPHLKRSEQAGDPWHSHALTVARPTIAKDPSIQALGIGGAVTGARLDLVVMDDVLDFDNTRTPEQRKKLVEWMDSTILTRVTEGGRVEFISTPWHPDDLGHVLARRPGWESRIYSAVLNPDDPPEQWQPLWPEQFSRERLLDIYKTTTPHNFARKYLCRVRADEASRFRKEWLDAMVEAGRGWGPFRRAPATQGVQWPCFTGVDLGVGEKQEDALTVLFTIALEPTGRRRRVVLEIQSGRWTAPEIVRRLQDVYARYQSLILVESNGAQRFLVQFAGDRLPVRPFFTTSQNKFDEHFGVESLAVEIRNGLWVLPSGRDGDPGTEAREWMREMLYYAPEAHTGDRLMASWFAREGARQYAPSVFGRHELQER